MNCFIVNCLLRLLTKWELGYIDRWNPAIPTNWLRIIAGHDIAARPGNILMKIIILSIPIQSS